MKKTNVEFKIYLTVSIPVKETKGEVDEVALDLKQDNLLDDIYTMIITRYKGKVLDIELK